MARPTLFRHPKFRKLARAVGGEALALGSLELLWSTGYELGSEIIGDADDIENAAHWVGEPGKLYQALHECGFIDLLEDGKFAIHDFWDHAPDYVSRRRQREMARQERGVTLSEVRSIAGKQGASKRWQADSKEMASESQLPAVNGKRMANVSTPAPAPAPAPQRENLLPTSEPPTRKLRSAPPRCLKEWEDLFPKFWDKYPHKVAKLKALEAWRKMSPKRPEDVIPLARGIGFVLAERIRSTWKDRESSGIPYPATFLHSEEFNPRYEA